MSAAEGWLATELQQMGCYKYLGTIGVSAASAAAPADQGGGRQFPAGASPVRHLQGEAPGEHICASLLGNRVFGPELVDRPGRLSSPGGRSNVASETILCLLNGLGIHAGVMPP